MNTTVSIKTTGIWLSLNHSFTSQTIVPVAMTAVVGILAVPAANAGQVMVTVIFTANASGSYNFAGRLTAREQPLTLRMTAATLNLDKWR